MHGSCELSEVVGVELLTEASAGANIRNSVGALIVDVVLLVGKVNINSHVLRVGSVSADSDILVPGVED